MFPDSYAPSDSVSSSLASHSHCNSCQGAVSLAAYLHCWKIFTVISSVVLVETHRSNQVVEAAMAWSSPRCGLPFPDLLPINEATMRRPLPSSATQASCMNRGLFPYWHSVVLGASNAVKYSVESLSHEWGLISPPQLGASDGVNFPTLPQVAGMLSSM